MARSRCVNLSLQSIVEDRRPKERISFEAGVGAGDCGVVGGDGVGTLPVVMLMASHHLRHQATVLAELFLEMLQRDFGYRIYKTLLSLPEKVVAPPEPEKEEAAKEEAAVKEEAKEPKDEVQSEGTAVEADAPPVSISALHAGTGAAGPEAPQSWSAERTAALLSLPHTLRVPPDPGVTWARACNSPVWPHSLEVKRLGEGRRAWSFVKGRVVARVPWTSVFMAVL